MLNKFKTKILNFELILKIYFFIFIFNFKKARYELDIAVI